MLKSINCLLGHSVSSDYFCLIYYIETNLFPFCLSQRCSLYKTFTLYTSVSFSGPLEKGVSFFKENPVTEWEKCVLISQLSDTDFFVLFSRLYQKTVRLMVNYHGSQKAVVRVNPLVPLQALTPVICDKCEFDPAHVLLLRDGISRRELPLDKSLTELGIKELYVHDQTQGKC